MLSSDAEIINLPISDGRAGFLGQNIFDKDNKLIEAPLKSVI